MSEHERRQLAPGIWLEGNVAAIDVPQVLAHLGLDDTQENRDLFVKVARQVWLKLPNHETFTVTDRCPICQGQGRVFVRPFPTCAECAACGGTGKVRVG